MDNNEKTYYPEVIKETPFPNEILMGGDVSQPSANGTYSPATIQDQSFPDKRQAVELLSTSLNTRSRKILGQYGFTPSGAIQIGQYENGISGDVRISPAGIIARNSSGNNTVVIDGDTGDGIFAGELRSGTFITGQVILGDNNIVLNGEDRRMIINDGTNDRVLIGFQSGGF